jgi:hypothetical protein
MEGSVALALLVLALWVLAVVAFAFWVHRTRPVQVYAKYPPQVTRTFAVPFWNSWKQRVDAGDLRVVELWRRRYFARYLALIGLPALVFLAYATLWGFQLSEKTQGLVEQSQETLRMLNAQRTP